MAYISTKPYLFQIPYQDSRPRLVLYTNPDILHCQHTFFPKDDHAVEPTTTSCCERVDAISLSEPHCDLLILDQPLIMNTPCIRNIAHNPLQNRNFFHGLARLRRNTILSFFSRSMNPGRKPKEQNERERAVNYIQTMHIGY